jgi:MFS family permease
MSSQIESAKKATRTIFLVCGLGISSWAPMVPFAKERLGLNDANLGLMLLLLGAGAITFMPLSAYLGHKYGSKIVICYTALLTAIMLPFLMFMDSVVRMGICLFIFGGAIGGVDVAMNAHGAQVQNLIGKPIMSSLHGLFSVGGLLGSIGLGYLIKLGLDPFWAAVFIAGILILIVLSQYRNLLDVAIEKSASLRFTDRSESKLETKTSWFNRHVIFLGILCFIIFLSEGAMLDWSAVFLLENRGVSEEFGGMGYAAFSVAMAAMRLVGDRMVAKFNSKTVVVGGSIIGAIGLLLAVATPWVASSLFGFILLGIGAANIVPVFFSEGGRIKNIPASVSIPAITTIGYAGQLAGPALLGFIAYVSSLPVALGFCAVLMLCVAALYGLRSTPNQ